MKTWQITIEHTATGRRYIVPVLARTKAEALIKASDWPYSTAAYIVITTEGEGK